MSAQLPFRTSDPPGDRPVKGSFDGGFRKRHDLMTRPTAKRGPATNRKPRQACSPWRVETSAVVMNPTLFTVQDLTPRSLPDPKVSAKVSESPIFVTMYWLTIPSSQESAVRSDVVSID